MPPSNTITKMMYAGARPKQKTTPAFAHNNSLTKKHSPERHSFHVPLGKPITNELPAEWMDNEEVLFWLRG